MQRLRAGLHCAYNRERRAIFFLTEIQYARGISLPAYNCQLVKTKKEDARTLKNLSTV